MVIRSGWGEDEAEMGSEPRPKNRLVLFLGAGSSVGADVPTTQGLVGRWRRRLEDWATDVSGISPMGLKIADSLRPNDDVEALLRLLEQLSNLPELPLRGFVKPSKDLPDVSELKRMTKYLKTFIQNECFVSKEKIDYLNPIHQLLEHYGRPLDIFSVNYDTAIEVFCMVNNIEFCNGFRGSWDPSIFADRKADVNLYKLHGSVTWYITDEGRIVEIPLHRGGIENLTLKDLLGEKEDLELYYGSRAETLMIYPYDPTKAVPLPTLDVLALLRDRLRDAGMLVIVGYSFRDREIKEIFWDSARRNKDLSVVLVGPSSYKLYQDELKEMRVGVRSPLEGRVTCLPFLFEKVFPCLHDHHLVELRMGLDRYRRDNLDEVRYGKRMVQPEEWLYVAQHLASGGDFERVLGVIGRCGIDRWNPSGALGVVIKAYVSAALSNAPQVEDLGALMDTALDRLTSAFQVALRPPDIGLWIVPEGWPDKKSRREMTGAFKEGAQYVEHLISMVRKDRIPKNIHLLLEHLQSSASYLDEKWPSEIGDYFPISAYIQDRESSLSIEWKNELEDLSSQMAPQEDVTSSLATHLTELERDLFRRNTETRSKGGQGIGE